MSDVATVRLYLHSIALFAWAALWAAGWHEIPLLLFSVAVATVIAERERVRRRGGR